MSAHFKRYAFHPWLIAAFPGLALLAHNVTQVSASAAIRPLLASLTLAAIVWLLVWLLIRHWARAALYTSLALVLFFSYGQVYHYVLSVGKDAPWSWHQILGPATVLVLVLGISAIQRLRRLASVTLALNMATMILLALPLLTLLTYYGSDAASTRRVKAASAQESLRYAGPGRQPDVYFIVLDTYMRGDALLRDMDYDNSAFLASLEEMGFFVAGCGRPNYDYTRASLTSTLNMNYLPTLRRELETQGNVTPRALWALTLPSKVRRLLEDMGYRTVAFQTTYSWTEIHDADVYLAPGRRSPADMRLLPFEGIFLRTTPAVILMKSGAAEDKVAAGSIKFPYNYHVETERLILDTLPLLARMPGPKYVFVHILIPHTPYVFKPDGTIRVDSRYYGGKNMNAVSWQYQVEGYVDSVKYINSRMLPILRTLIEDSDVPPIIVLEGDHGLNDENRTQNLSAYFLPGDGSQDLYGNITPVNSFRVIFNHYFGAKYELLPDETFSGFTLESDGRLVKETAPECLP